MGKGIGNAHCAEHLEDADGDSPVAILLRRDYAHHDQHRSELHGRGKNLIAGIPGEAAEYDRAESSQG
jgi:hypothetical protein